MKREKPAEDRVFGFDCHNRGQNCDEWATWTIVVDLVSVKKGITQNLLRCAKVIRSCATKMRAAERKAAERGR